MSRRMKLTILGSGDPFCSGGRNQSGYLLEAGDFRILLDCGVTTLAALKRLGLDPAALDLVLLTHLHGDHVAGLPFLYHEFKHLRHRVKPLLVAGPSGVKSRIETLHRVLFPSKGGKRRRFEVSYRVLVSGRPFSPAGREGPGISPFRVRHQRGRINFGYRIGWKGRELAYSGDTGWFPELPSLVRGANLFLCECTYPSGKSGKHLSLEELRGNRDNFQVGSILLTHLGPDLARRRPISGFPMAKDGRVILV
jgi:ribonuclease BN (tRNA processing enzyme)